MRYNQGTVAFEQGLSTSLTVNDFVSIPLGFSYHSADGFVLEHPALVAQDGPGLYGDVLLPYVQVKGKVSLGPIYFEAFGGGTLAWAFTMNPTGKFFDPAFASPGTTVAMVDLTLEKGLGFGWMGGAGFGVELGQISIELSGAWRLSLINI